MKKKLSIWQKVWKEFGHIVNSDPDVCCDWGIQYPILKKIVKKYFPKYRYNWKKIDTDYNDWYEEIGSSWGWQQRKLQTLIIANRTKKA